jgi:GNAT superfamily N-acetyltransferase
MVSAALALVAAAATATLASRGQSARLASEAIGVLVGQLEPQFAAGRLGVVDLVLGNAAGFVLNFHFQFIRRNHLDGEVEDLGKLLRGKPMIGIVASHPGLEKAGFDPTDRASAIHEVLHHIPDLRDVEIRRDRIAVRQDKSDIQVCVLAEVCLEGFQIHATIGICSYRYIQAEIAFRPLALLDYEQVVTLWRRCDGIEVAEGDDRESFARYLGRNPGLSYAAVSGGAIVGAALCGHDGRRGLVYHLAVAPEYRGQGVDKQILKMGLAGLRECGIARTIILVAKDNSLGQEFWISQGFEHISGALPLGTDLL